MKPGPIIFKASVTPVPSEGVQMGQAAHEYEISVQHEAEHEVCPATLDEWRRLSYQTAHSDIWTAKHRGWQIVSWSILLDGALISLAHKTIDDLVPSWAWGPTIGFGVLCALVASVNTWWLQQTHKSADGYRTRGNTAVIEALGERRARRMDCLADVEDHKHKQHHRLQIAAVVLAGILSLVVIVGAKIA